MVSGFPPVWDGDSRVLILGTLPSPRSRENGFYYTHPRNRFFPVLAEVLGVPVPENNAGRIGLLLQNHIALWDVLARCDIVGAQDQSIRNPVPNDLAPILRAADIRAVFTTGSAASRLYGRFFSDRPMPPHIALPSTSPANCRMPFALLAERYREILPFLGEGRP